MIILQFQPICFSNIILVCFIKWKICLITYGLSENQGNKTVSSFDELPPSRFPILFTWKIACLQVINKLLKY